MGLLEEVVMQSFRMDPKRKHLRNEVADELGLEGPRAGGSLRGATCGVHDRHCDLQRLKLRLHRFFVNLPQHPR